MNWLGSGLFFSKPNGEKYDFLVKIQIDLKLLITNAKNFNYLINISAGKIATKKDSAPF